MAEEETLQKLLEACCSQQYCTCKEKPGAPCGKDGNSLEVTVEVVTQETTDTNGSENAGAVKTNLGSEKCATAEQICCICGKPIRPSSSPVEDTVVVESPEPAGCGLDECDTEFCTAQELPCENMEEPEIPEGDTADACDAVETAEVPEAEEGSPEPEPEPTENADGENETGPSDELPEGEKKACPCKGGSKDPPPEE